MHRLPKLDLNYAIGITKDDLINNRPCCNKKILDLYFKYGIRLGAYGFINNKLVFTEDDLTKVKKKYCQEIS